MPRDIPGPGTTRMDPTAGSCIAATLAILSRALERLRAAPPEGTAAVWAGAVARLAPDRRTIEVSYATRDGATATIATIDPGWQGATFPPHGATFAEALWRVLHNGRPLVPEGRWPEDLSPLRGLLAPGEARPGLLRRAEPTRPVPTWRPAVRQHLRPPAARRLERRGRVDLGHWRRTAPVDSSTSGGCPPSVVGSLAHPRAGDPSARAPPRLPSQGGPVSRCPCDPERPGGRAAAPSRPARRPGDCPRRRL
jgi:hypothetical protein